MSEKKCDPDAPIGEWVEPVAEGVWSMRFNENGMAAVREGLILDVEHLPDGSVVARLRRGK